MIPDTTGWVFQHYELVVYELSAPKHTSLTGASGGLVQVQRLRHRHRQRGQIDQSALFLLCGGGGGVGGQ